MKRFINRTRYLQKIKFNDGVTQFLQFGDEILSSKAYDFVSDGVEVLDEKKSTKKKTKSTSENKIEEVNE